jgi:hypothetical protein
MVGAQGSQSGITTIGIKWADVAIASPCRFTSSGGMRQSHRQRSGSVQVPLLPRPSAGLSGHRAPPPVSHHLTSAAIAFFLNRRARDRSVGAVDAALALDRLHTVAASLTVVDVLTGISGHGLGCAVTAFWTRDDGLQFHWLPPHCIRRSGRLVPVGTPDESD